MPKYCAVSYKSLTFQIVTEQSKMYCRSSLVGGLMFVSDEEAAAMYARWCRNWYGVNAKSVVKSKIRTLMAKGDRKGVRAWQQVADALERQTAEVCATVHFKESPSHSRNSFSAAST